MLSPKSSATLYLCGRTHGRQRHRCLRRSLPESSLKTCLEADSALLSAIGGPKWDTIDPAIRPEKGLLALRAGMGLYANLRPSKLIPSSRRPAPAQRYRGKRH